MDTIDRLLVIAEKQQEQIDQLWKAIEALLNRLERIEKQ